MGVSPDAGRRMVNRADYALGKAVLLGNQDVALKALRAKGQLGDAMKVNFMRYDTKPDGVKSSIFAGGPEKWIPKRDRSI